MHYGAHASKRVQGESDQRLVLLRLDRGEGTAEQLTDELAARLGDAAKRRVGHALLALREAEHVERVGPAQTSRPVWRITEAGRARAAELREKSTKPSLPVLPETITPGAAFECARRGATMTVSQCAGAWESRGGVDLPCGRDVSGAETRTGCPTGEKAAGALKARKAARGAALRQQRKERQALS